MTERNQWQSAILNAVSLVGTPCYIAAAAPLRENLERLENTLRGLPVRHFLSAKTQPIKALFELWNKWGRDIEVVSECEFVAAIEVGFNPKRILVNGVSQTFLATEISISRPSHSLRLGCRGGTTCCTGSCTKLARRTAVQPAPNSGNLCGHCYGGGYGPWYR
jgi:hypothetical protein